MNRSMKLVWINLYNLMTLLTLLFYHVISSFILIFIPRRFRRIKDIKGQRVLITGAGSGLGRELAVEFSKHAACLILVDINRQSLFQTQKLLDQCSSVFIYDCDVSDYKKVYEMAKKVQKDAGDVDILVNNAGIVTGKYLMDLPEEKIIKTMEVNALAHFWTCKAFLPAMMKKNRGHIVNVISVACKSGGPRVTDYCASKFAALGFAESLELELRLMKLDGIKITLVCPGVIDSGLFKGASLKFARNMTPEYAARETVKGVLQEEEMIYLPNYLKYIVMIKEMIPRSLTVRSHEITGNIKVMDNFVGREQVENGFNTSDKSKKAE